MENNKNESKKNLPVVRQAFMAKKTTTNYCSPQCSKRGYKHRMKERRMEMREFQEMLEVKNKTGEPGILYLFSSSQTNGSFSPVCL